jgi:hypothetical protein
VISVNRDDGHTEQFPDATRVSTDEANNLEVWGGHDGDALLWLCAAGHWVDVALDPEGS